MPHTLLLADDSVTIQRVIELTFADEDVRVIAVGDGQQAIDAIDAEQPDIVLADVSMPLRDGYEVAAHVKSTPHLAHIPVLLLTGAFEPVDEERAKAAACDGVLAKPFEPQMVISRVKELLLAASALRAVEPPSAPEAEPTPAPESLRIADEIVDGPALDAALDGLPAEPQAESEDSWPEEPVADFDVQIRRRPPVIGEPLPAGAAVTAEGEGSEASDEATPIDDYFDRLDAAFATLVKPPPAVEQEPLAEGSSIHAETAPLAETAPGRGIAPEPVSQPPVPHRDVPAYAAFPPPAAAPPEPPGPAAAGADRSPVAQAFNALLAAERGVQAAPELQPIWPAQGLSAQSLEEIVQRATQQVLERMTDRVVKDTVSDIVSRVAERLVREEIERVKASIK